MYAWFSVWVRVQTWQRGGRCLRCSVIMSWLGTPGQGLQSFSGISPSQSAGSSQLPKQLTMRALTRPITANSAHGNPVTRQSAFCTRSITDDLSLEGSLNLVFSAKAFSNSWAKFSLCRKRVPNQDAEKARESRDFALIITVSWLLLISVELNRL